MESGPITVPRSRRNVHGNFRLCNLETIRLFVRNRPRGFLDFYGFSRVDLYNQGDFKSFAAGHAVSIPVIPFRTRPFYANSFHGFALPICGCFPAVRRSLKCPSRKWRRYRGGPRCLECIGHWGAGDVYLWAVSIILLAFIPNAPQPTNTVPGATFQFVLPIERSARPCNCGTRQTATFAECHLTPARCGPFSQAVG